MKKIAVLGPTGTYSDIACRKYLKENHLDLNIEHYSTILQVANHISIDTFGIFPIENTLDGFVMEGMDQIILNQYTIISQMKLDIDFAFVSNAKDIKEIKNCYVQFKAYGQCLNFLGKHDFKIYTTHSNGESLSNLIASDTSFGAIVPMHILKDMNFEIEYRNIADSSTNQTRFFVVAKEKISLELEEDLEASIVITSKIDRPGILYDILKEFHDLNINLNSIMSRPTKKEMGKYHFYIECGLKKSAIKDLDSLVLNLEKQDIGIVHILGIYNKL